MLQNTRVKSVALALILLAGASVLPTTAAAQPSSAVLEPSAPTPVPTQAAAESQAQTETDLGFLVEAFGERIHPNVLLNASIDTSRFQPLVQELSSAHIELATSRDAILELDKELEKQQASKVKLSAQLEQAQVKLKTTTKDASEASAGLKSYADATFENPPTPMWLDTFTTGKTSIEAGLLRQIEEDLATTHSTLQAKHEQHQNDVDRLTRSRDKIIVDIDSIEVTLDETERRVIELEAKVETLSPQLVDKVLLAPVNGLPFPVVVLDAYYQAQLITAETKPKCDVSWSQLAGIGKVETVHGTYGGGTVGDDGRTSKPITGPELNGDPFLAIPDTDGGLLDNNPVWDHAVGPMQFIPTSWELYGADGNGDGVNDPHNMYDATLAAANHLCGSRSQLSNTSNFTAALLGYNRSTSYGVSVKRHATSYSAVLSLD